MRTSSFTAQAVTNTARDGAFPNYLSAGEKGKIEIERAAVRAEFAAAESVTLDELRTSTAGTPQELVAQVAGAVECVARLGKDMADVNFEVGKLMMAQKAVAELERLREEFAEVKLEVVKLAKHQAWTQRGLEH